MTGTRVLEDRLPATPTGRELLEEAERARLARNALHAVACVVLGGSVEEVSIVPDVPLRLHGPPRRGRRPRREG